MIDATHAPGRRSWVESANAHPNFPIQNLPFVIFSTGEATPRGGVAIGAEILDLAAACAAGLFAGEAERAAQAASGPLLNPLFALGAPPRFALRARLCELLDAQGPERARVEPLHGRLMHRSTDCRLHLPARIGDFTDFYAGIHHATNTGRQLRPEAPLLPSYKYLPVAYQGRSSSVVASGAPVRRPNGQRKRPAEPVPSFGLSRALDHELELGVWIGPGNDLGVPIPIAEAPSHVAGFCLLNDWSARDIQGWETQPLGPFMGKNFATTVSPWVVTPEALAPFRIAAARAEGDPVLLDYLLDENDQRAGALDIGLEVFLCTAEMHQKNLSPQRLALSNARYLYWTAAQLVAHHASNGCNLSPGDLFGSGTISGPGEDGMGSLLEITQGGRKPLTLASGETRRFLEDGDEVIFRAFGRRDGFVTIGFGECRGTVVGGAQR
jgi:fumarylacetoacetase